MAYFTETYLEWLEDGGVIPASFGLIEGFAKAFENRYCDREIGFETPELFQRKLDLRASEVMPIYSARLSAFEKLDYEPKKKSTSNATIGKRKTSMADLPIDAVSSTEPVPSTISATDEAIDSATSEASGFTPSERIEWERALMERRTSILQTCLDEFEPLFMQVYSYGTYC